MTGCGHMIGMGQCDLKLRFIAGHTLIGIGMWLAAICPSGDPILNVPMEIGTIWFSTEYLLDTVHHWIRFVQ